MIPCQSGEPGTSAECANHLLNDALDDVKLIAADDDLLAFIEGTESLQLGLDARPQPVTPDDQSVDRTHAHTAAVLTYPSRHGPHRHRPGSSR